MRKQIKKTFFLLSIFLILPNFVFAAPSVSTIAGAIKDGSAVTIYGSGFGSKQIVAPRYFGPKSTDANGSVLPTPLYHRNPQSPVLSRISSELQRTVGSKALLFDFNVEGINNNPHQSSYPLKEQFIQTMFDFGTGVDNVYFSAWIYLDKINSTADSFDHKLIVLSSNPNGYWDLSTPGATSMGTSAWWRNSPEGFFNVFVTGYYVPTTGGRFISAESTNPSLPSDAYLFNQWQRVELIWKRSSSGGVNDGRFIIRRIGRLTSLADLPITSHDQGGLPWRYLDFGMSLDNIYTGIGRLKQYYNDIYLDNTQARIEICNSSTWSNRNNCEIQIPFTWSDASITFIVNQATFNNGATAYLYVVDSTGAVNANGYPITFGSGTPPDTTPPAAPTGLSVN